MSLKVLLARQKPFVVGVLPFVWQGLFFYVPLLFMCLLSFFHVNQAESIDGFTLAHYVPFLSLNYLYIIFKSLALASITSLLCFFVGYPLAHYICFKARRKNTLLFFLLLPFWTNFLLHIYAWFFVLERTGFINNLLVYSGIISQPLHLLNSLGTVILLMVYCYLPFMVLPIYSVLERFDKKLIEASADLGGTPWQTWSRIVLPVSLNGIASGFFLVFVPAFGEFVIPGLLGGERYVFVGTVISQYILGSRTLSLGAAFTVLSCIAIMLVILLLYYVGSNYFKKNKLGGI